ncbi:MAG TPA: SRPBCC family protein [Longimicrobiales bacterium]|nr:SRPBCC family protein [Longimicrobiales bacterium]
MPITFSLLEDYDAPPARVYRALTDLDDAGAWMTGLVRIERLDPGPLVVGSRWRETRRMFGREASEEFEVTRLEPPAHLALRCDGTKGASGCGEFLFDFELEPQAGGTRLTLHGEIRGMGGMWQMFGKLFAGSYRRAVRKDLAALRQHLVKEMVPAAPL